LAGNTQAALTALKPNKKNSAQSNPQALPLEALCYLSSGDLAAARQTIAKLNDLNSTEPLATFATGYLAYKDGDYKKALSALNSAASQRQKPFPGTTNSGQNQFKTRRCNRGYQPSSRVAQDIRTVAPSSRPRS
jgi:tetratricopeptide (TPR) repeat protein